MSKRREFINNLMLMLQLVGIIGYQLLLGYIIGHVIVALVVAR